MHFYYHRCLFKRDKREFNDNIKCVLIKLFSHNAINDTQLHMFRSRTRIVNCMICLQVIHTINMRFVTSTFLICNICCNECINISAYVEFWNQHDKIEMYWFVHNDDTSIDAIFNRSMHMINNSHKLIHRFYNTTIITFLLSKLDNDSYCHDLNLDVMLHVLKFIY